jgi:hypothetical protein
MFLTDKEQRPPAFADLPTSQVLARLAHLLLVGVGGCQSVTTSETAATTLTLPSGMFSSPFPKYTPSEAYAIYVARGFHEEDACLLPTPFQEELVFACPSPLDKLLSGKSSGSAGMYGLWEQNIDQMKSVYAFYAHGGGALRRESMSGNSMKTTLSSMNKSHSAIEAVAVSTSKQKDSSMLDFDKCKTILQNFQIFPKHVDLKTIQALYRYTKQWEWTWAEAKLATASATPSRSAKDGAPLSSTPTKNARRHVRASISFLALEREKSHGLGHSSEAVESKTMATDNGSTAISVTAKDVRKCETTTLLTFRGFVEFMTRLALYIHVHNLDHNSQVSVED